MELQALENTNESASKNLIRYFDELSLLAQSLREYINQKGATHPDAKKLQEVNIRLTELVEEFGVRL
jgi:hypothetical protein